MSHPNPILVFVVPAMAGIDAAYLPMGWKMDGTRCNRDQLSTQESYSVFVLDDQNRIPEGLEFRNKDPGKPLLVVGHRSSLKNNFESIRNDPVLLLWGKPHTCETFSHMPNDETWKEIQALISGAVHPREFIKRRRNGRESALYDKLAAICQLKIIDPTSETPELESLLRELPLHFANEFGAEGRGWLGRLQLVRVAAESLVALGAHSDDVP